MSASEASLYPERTLRFSVSAVDPPTLLAVSATLGAVALVANLLPAHRAQQVDPIEALRAE